MADPTQQPSPQHHEFEFLTLPYPLENLLAQARSYPLAMTLTHQHVRQLPQAVRDGISTNTHSSPPSTGTRSSDPRSTDPRPRS